MPRVWKHMLVTCTTIGVIVSALLVVMSHSKVQEMAQAVALPEVEVVQVAQQDVPISSEWIGTLDGMVNATIKAQVTGYLRKQRYTEGAFVTQGQVLFEIDPRPFQAALDQAKGELAKAQGQLVQANAQLVQANAQLAQAEANQGKTQLDVDRYIPLAKAQAITAQDLDNAVQNNLAAKAQVAAAKAGIETAKAAIVAAKAAVEAAKAVVATATLNLGFTTILSPIDGIAGIATAQVGDLVGPNSGTLTTVSTLDPIKVYFTASEQDYLNFIRRNPTRRRATRGTEAPRTGAGVGRRDHVSAQRHVLRRGPRGECANGCDPAGRTVPEPRQYSAPWPVWPGARGDQAPRGRAARAAARRHRAARPLPGRRRGQREQDQHPDRQGRRARRHDVGHR